MWANFEAAEELTIRKQLWTLSKRMGVGMTKFICQVPIIFSTCGLVDTVQEGYTGFHMGAFNVECEAVDPVDVEKLATTVKRALGTYGTPAMTQMIQNCMAQDFSWKGPAKQWEKVLLSLEVAGSEPGIDGDEIAPLAKENVANP